MILVTGGAGYIGAHTNKALNQAGYETVVVDNLSKGYENFVKEVSNRTLLMEDGKIVDDSEDVDKAVDNFINLCHADYLKENN